MYWQSVGGFAGLLASVLKILEVSQVAHMYKGAGVVRQGEGSR